MIENKNIMQKLNFRSTAFHNSNKNSAKNNKASSVASSKLATLTNTPRSRKIAAQSAAIENSHSFDAWFAYGLLICLTTYIIKSFFDSKAKNIIQKPHDSNTENSYFLSRSSNPLYHRNFLSSIIGRFPSAAHHVSLFTVPSSRNSKEKQRSFASRRRARKQIDTETEQIVEKIMERQKNRLNSTKK